MKKIVALGLTTALFSFNGLAHAGEPVPAEETKPIDAPTFTTASTSITVNATVLSSCVFDTTAAGIASFNYDAVTGSTGANSGSATLYCNSGTTITLKTSETGTMSLKSATKNNSLNATYTLTSSTDAGAGAGTFLGADKYVYTLAPKADKGQWGAPTAADYTGTVDINVEF